MTAHSSPANRSFSSSSASKDSSISSVRNSAAVNKSGADLDESSSLWGILSTAVVSGPWDEAAAANRDRL